MTQTPGKLKYNRRILLEEDYDVYACLDDIK